MIDIEKYTVLLTAFISAYVIDYAPITAWLITIILGAIFFAIKGKKNT